MLPTLAEGHGPLRQGHLERRGLELSRRTNTRLLLQEAEKDRRGKTRDLFRKIENIKGTFCPKMGTIKDRNSRDLVEAEEIKKRWNEYTEELHKKDFNEADNQMV